MTIVNNHRSQNKQRKKIRNEKSACVYLEVDKFKYFQINIPELTVLLIIPMNP